MARTWGIWYWLEHGNPDWPMLLKSGSFILESLYETRKSSWGNHKRCSAHSVTCPSVTCPREGVHQSWPGGTSNPGWGLPLTWGTSQKGPGTSNWGTSSGRDLGPVTEIPPSPQKGHVISGSIMGWRWGNPSPLVDKQKGRHLWKHYLSVILRTRAVIKNLAYTMHVVWHSCFYPVFLCILLKTNT